MCRGHCGFPSREGAAGDAVPHVALGGAVQVGEGRTGLPAWRGLGFRPPFPISGTCERRCYQAGMDGHRSSVEFCAAVWAVGLRPTSSDGCFRMPILRPGVQSQPGGVWGGRAHARPQVVLLGRHIGECRLAARSALESGCVLVPCRLLVCPCPGASRTLRLFHYNWGCGEERFTLN